MMNPQFAASIHTEYRMKAENEAETYNRLKTAYPFNAFPKAAARLWRYAVLAEAWGAIATKLSGDKKDYLNDWRTGA